MTLELAGRLVICVGIIASMILFVAVNVNYTAPKDKAQSRKEPEDDSNQSA
jgi:hypothetical protein